MGLTTNTIALESAIERLQSIPKITPIEKGGTGADNAADARTNLGISLDGLGAIGKMKLLAAQNINYTTTMDSNLAQVVGEIPPGVEAEIIFVYFTGKITPITVFSYYPSSDATLTIGRELYNNRYGLNVHAGTYNKSLVGYVLNNPSNLSSLYSIASGKIITLTPDDWDDDGYPRTKASVNGTLEYYGIYLT